MILAVNVEERKEVRRYRLFCATLVAMAVSLAAGVQAQESILGTYSGSFTVPSMKGDLQLGLELVITAVKDGIADGTAKIHQGPCAGDYVMQGKLEGDSLQMQATTKGGAQEIARSA